MNRIDDLRALVAEFDALTQSNTGLTNQIAALTTERDEWRDAARSEADRVNELTPLLAAANTEIARLTALLAAYKPRFIMGDSTRQRFLGDGFTPFWMMYESEFYPSGMPNADRPKQPVDYDLAFARATAFLRDNPLCNCIGIDIEWYGAREEGDPAAVMPEEVQFILPAFRAVRDAALALGRRIEIAGYNIPPRSLNHLGGGPSQLEPRTEQWAANSEVLRPVMDISTEATMGLYPLTADLPKTTQYVITNIAMARRLMPGKKVYVYLWPVYHANAGAAFAGKPVSAEWMRTALDACLVGGADGAVIWLKANAPKPTNEPWWLETLDFGRARGVVR